MVMRIDDDQGSGKQLACIVATPEALGRLVGAQEQIVEAMTTQAILHQHQVALNRAAVAWAFASSALSVIAIIVALATR